MDLWYDGACELRLQSTERRAVDVGIVFGLSGILIAIFIATIMFVWQANSVSNRFDAGFQALGERVDAKIEAQGAEIKALGERLEAEIKAQSVRLEAEIKVQGQRVSDLELEQARLNGVNSVMTRQAHTHESLAD